LRIAAGALVALVVFRDGLNGLCHARSPYSGQRGRRQGRSVPAPPLIDISAQTVVHEFVNVYLSPSLPAVL
jgi:hypothetical protein